MPPESASSESGRLSLEVRAALDLIVLRCGGGDRPPRGRLLGATRLIEALRGYGWQDAESPLVVLASERDELLSAVLGAAPDRVLVLRAGPLARFAGLRWSGGVASPRLSTAAWRRLGYAPTEEAGIFGPASIAWAVAERFARRGGRPEYADRCRLAMLRSLIASAPGRLGSRTMVCSYQRVGW